MEERKKLKSARWLASSGHKPALVGEVHHHLDAFDFIQRLLDSCCTIHVGHAFDDQLHGLCFSHGRRPPATIGHPVWSRWPGRIRQSRIPAGRKQYVLAWLASGGGNAPATYRPARDWAAYRGRRPAASKLRARRNPKAKRPTARHTLGRKVASPTVCRAERLV